MGTEKRYPIILPSNQKEVIFSTNSLLAMVLIIKIPHMHLAILTGVLKKCMQVVNGMVYVRMCFKDLMLENTDILMLLMPRWRFSLHTKLCLENVAKHGWKIILNFSM